MTTAIQILDAIMETIVRELDVTADRVVMEAAFIDDLEADSLDMVELIMSLEEDITETFGKKISISDEQASEIRTVGDACNLVAELLG